MPGDDLVYGLVSPPAGSVDPGYALRLRDLTLSWSRYGYRGPVVEGATVDDVLTRAHELGFRLCLLQGFGHVILEKWHEHGTGMRFEDCIERWTDREFLVLGELVGGPDGGYGLDEACLLVDVGRWSALGQPAFGAPGPAPVERMKPSVVCGKAVPGEEPTRLLAPSSQRERGAPGVAGWHLVDASLRAGLPVPDLGPALARLRVSLERLHPGEARRFAHRLGDGIDCHRVRDDELPADVSAFLTEVERQVANARRGVFLWNLESCDDVRVPPERWEPPISTLLTVASGFKPNMILESLGFDERTLVVYFDYSAPALEAKRLLLREWDGTNFPAFARLLFERLPVSETYYQLPSGKTPDTLARGVLETEWARALDLWGGARAFEEHWERYRALRHEFVHCDVVTDPRPVLDHVGAGRGCVVWWSNAFFTVSTNWLRTIGERRLLFERWVDELAERNPDLLLYGADHCNGSVNDIRADEYWRLLRATAGDGLLPLKAGACEIRF
ncbi:MAG: hypothetical protein H0U03_09145 [Actinobacteria bacterium]|nr:hypothetical protein [Actinomycetota bacterium]